MKSEWLKDCRSASLPLAIWCPCPLPACRSEFGDPTSAKFYFTKGLGLYALDPLQVNGYGVNRLWMMKTKTLINFLFICDKNTQQKSLTSSFRYTPDFTELLHLR